MARESERFTTEQAREIAEILKAVGHPVRLRIVEYLAVGELCVGDLAEKISEKQAIISQQLKILRMVGLVKTERRDGKSFYRINNPHLYELLNCMQRCVCIEKNSIAE
jgi:DNA-binding transcriptional ArsR family regulator